MKSTRVIRILPALFVILGVLFLIFWIVKKSDTSVGKTSSKVQIVASTNVWGDIASQIGDQHVEVTSILNDPQTDPHLFESDAATASRVASADLVIINGLGYDEFMDKLLGTTSKDQNSIDISQVLKADKDANPHLWYDLPRIPEVAITIQNELIKIDPDHAADYRQNTQEFVGSITQLNRQLTKQQGGVAYTERVAGYMLEALGVENLTPQGFAQSVESGTEPTPQQVQEFETVLQSGRVKVLIYNTQSVNDMTEQLKRTAEASRVAVVGVTETVPKGKNFQTWQAEQLRAILEAL